MINALSEKNDKHKQYVPPLLNVFDWYIICLKNETVCRGACIDLLYMYTIDTDVPTSSHRGLVWQNLSN